MRPSTKMRQWQQTQNAWDTERDRINYLRTAPLPVTPPEIMRPTRCRVVKPTFCIGGKQVQVDSIIVMPFCDAKSLETLGKVQILE